MKKIRTIICLFMCVTLLAGCALRPENNPEATKATPEEIISSEEISGNTGHDEPIPAEPADLENEGYVADSVSVNDAKRDLTITVLAPQGYSAEDVLAGMKLSNFTNPALTDPEETDLLEPDYLTAEGGDGVFTVSCVNGFNAGEVYQISLEDAALTYEGQEEAVRFYNIATAGEETHNMRLAGNVQFLNAGELNKNDSELALQYDGIFRYDYQSSGIARNNVIGSFTYEQGAYNIGDIVAVYEGQKPDERSLDVSEEGVAYIKIKGIQPQEGTNALYMYEGAAPEEVLFTPDVIPLGQECSLGEGEEGSVTVNGDELLFSSDGEFASMGLDENTVVEPGDYLAFYTGNISDGEVEAYGEITDIVWTENENGPDTVNISFIVSSVEDLISSVDLYKEGTLTEEQIRSSYDEEAIKAGVIEDLTNNGYLIESSYNLAKTALETDEARELFKDTELEDLTFYYGDEEEYSLSGKDYLKIADGIVANDVEIKGKPDVVISPNIVHFAGKTGYGMGVRVEAHSQYTITIRGSELAKAGLKITLTFFFEAEVAMGLTIDATSVWKKWWIFPYLYDYNVSGSSTNGIYVGVGFTACATLFENKPSPEDEANAAGIPWPDEVDRTPGAEKVMAVAEYIKELSEKHESIFPPQTSGGGSLSEKYAGFIKTAEKSWVDIINENIFDWNGSLDPFHIIAFRIKADFVVSAQLNAALGIGANYERAYRSTFSFMLFHDDESATKNEDTNISRFRADFYVFGAMGIRAGLRLTLAAGLFDARLDSIGIEIEGGIYERLWGFFYAGIEINDVGKGAESDMYYAGGFRAEAGGYYSFTFVAQAGDGAISYKKYMGGGEYPFLALGVDSVINDFGYPEDDTGLDFGAEFTDYNHKAIIPEAAFMMSAMSLKDGSVSNISKSGSDTAQLFDISFDDPNFSYSYENGKHILTRADAPGGEGTVNMTIKWKGTSFEKLSRDLTRTIHIKWVANKRTMKFLNKDGSIFFMTTKPEGTALTEEDLPSEEPTAHGYEFTGWLDTDGSPLTEMPKVMPDKNTEYKSSWVGVPVPVNVQYYQPLMHDSYGKVIYQLDDTDVIDGIFRYEEKVDNIIPVLTEHHLLRTLPDYDHEGKEPYTRYRIYEWDSELSSKSVNYDGSTTFKICMEYDTFTVRYDDGAGNITTREYFPGVQIEFPEVSRQGFIFREWQDENGEPVSYQAPPVCTGNCTFTAIWEKIPPTFTVRCQAKVKSWGMNYYWKDIHTEEIVTDSYEITVQELIDRVTPSGYVFDQNNTAWNPEDTISIAEDGTTLVTLRFKAE